MGLAGQLTDWPPEFVDRLVEAGFEVIVFDNRDSGLSTMTEDAGAVAAPHAHPVDAVSPCPQG